MVIVKSQKDFYTTNIMIINILSNYPYPQLFIMQQFHILTRIKIFLSVNGVSFDKYPVHTQKSHCLKRGFAVFAALGIFAHIVCRLYFKLSCSAAPFKGCKLRL